MAVLIALAVVGGFSSTIRDNLLHPVHPALARPPILYFHATLFFAWIGFFVFQTSLVRSHNVQLHPRLGFWGVGLGISLMLAGVGTEIIRRNTALAIASTMSP